jgi:hypothetical protein
LSVDVMSAGRPLTKADSANTKALKGRLSKQPGCPSQTRLVCPKACLANVHII